MGALVRLPHGHGPAMRSLFSIKFAKAIRGAIAIGAFSHYGLGLRFRA